MSLFSEKFPTHCAFRVIRKKFPQNFHTIKLGEVTVIYVVTRVMQFNKSVPSQKFFS